MKKTITIIIGLSIMGVAANATTMNSNVVLEYLAKNSNDTKVLDIISKENDVKNKILLTKNSNTPSYILDNLSKNENDYVRINVAKSNNLSLHTFYSLINDSNNLVRINLASNINTPSPLLERLAKNEDFFVRYNVGLNPNTPKNLLINLSKDNKTICSVFLNKNKPKELIFDKKIVSICSQKSKSNIQNKNFKVTKYIPILFDLSKKS